MKLHFLDKVIKRILFSLGLALVTLLVMGLISGQFSFNLYSVFVIMVIAYIPVTLFYAIASTFFTKEQPEQNDIIDN